MNLAERAAATDITKNWFVGRPFKFGVSDCACIVVFHLRGMGWKIATPKKGWDTPEQLARALKRFGGTGAAALDKIGLERIAPARVIIGDVVELPSDHRLGAFAIYAGNGRTLGFHEGAEGACIMQPTVPLVAAWRA